MKRGSHGYSLIELLLAVAILASIVAGISGVLVKQSQASAVQQAQRDLEENGRLALNELGRAVRLAGYGIDPASAFDFARFACSTPDSPGTCNGTGRDRMNAPDELVVAWRDPSFSRRVTALVGVGPWTVTLNAPLTADLQAGRLVSLLCDGALNVSYYALDSAATAVTAPTPQTISLRLLTPADGFFASVVPTGDGCYANAVVTLVERTRYYVANDSTGVSSLFRDRGRGQELLFRGIEDMQLSYDIGQPPAGSIFAADGTSAVAPPGCVDGSGNPTWSFGSCPGIAGSPSHTATAPDWRNEPYDAASRYTGNPANIRTVNIAVVARATRASPDGSGDSVLPILNRTARDRDSFRRAVMTLSEKPLNLLSRSYMLPPISPGSNNLGGG
ncbi:MAG TPA: prepilin-type N-terminal cleavage/methylation domain-containing protein [Myxococcales bacterium]|nr:prepilin-type N-terminal cleavage/methylation domain-containing protein [Myxococcales bacterium]